MHLLFAALVATAVACPSNPDPTTLLDANRAATMSGPQLEGTRTVRYSYHGHGLEGSVVTTIDLRTGTFVKIEATSPITEESGFDGRHAWMRDISGVYSLQAGGNKNALAINEAYRNANLWWRQDRGGARLESLGCDELRITPNGGQPFEAWFDPHTHLLVRVREAQTFGSTTETHYSGFTLRDGALLPSRIEIESNDDPTSQQTLQVSDFSTSTARSVSFYGMPDERPKDWSLSKPGRVTIPFTLLNNHIIVNVRIDGRGPYPFLLDTGGHNILTPSTAQELGITSIGDTPASGAGERSNTAGYAHVHQIDAGGVHLNDQTVVVLDFSPLSVEGIRLGGMLGVEFFERFVVQIDYGEKTLTFIDPTSFSSRDRSASGVAVPFVFYEHMPQVRGNFDGRPVRYNIDTGDRAEVSLTAPFVASEKLRDTYANGVKITEGWGVGGASKAYMVRAGELSLGSITTSRPVVGLSEAKHGAFSDPNYEGNIGSGLLKQYVVTFDYPGRTLYLKPTLHPDPDIGSFDRVGMWLNLGDGGMEVMDLAVGGPAELAGLKVGDVVVAIDGVSVSTRSLSEVRRSLKITSVGRPLAITYTRAGASATVAVIPRDLIPQ